MSHNSTASHAAPLGAALSPFVPPQRPGLQSRFWRVLSRCFFRYAASPRLPPEVRRRRIERFVRGIPPPAGTHLTRVTAGGVPAEWVTPPGVRHDAVLLYLHGGGYAAGSAVTHRVIAARLARLVGGRALLPEYRLAPEHPFPCAVEDAVAAYRWLVEQERVDPARVVVAGDSAGGGLALVLAVCVRDAGGRLPAALGGISPWTDLAGTGESMRTRAGHDPCFTPEDLRRQAREYLGDVDPTNPLASPLYADLHGLPPLLAQVGADELLRDDAQRLVERARAVGVDATVEVWPGMWHIFQTQGTFPESRQALQRLGHFLRQYLAPPTGQGPASAAIT